MTDAPMPAPALIDPVDPVEEATRRQRLAADPAVSAWVSASAGSGKTQVLTERILRLLLAGSPPESLLCLTYTKAAAANMANRLHQALADWARLEDGALSARLLRLTGTAPSAAQLAQARRLLAATLDAPGGMRIGTIHSFAQMLLRRFPLEADVAPHFSLLDEQEGGEILRDAREGVLAGAAATPALEAALDLLARRFAPKSFGELVARLVARGTAPHDAAGMGRLLGLPAGVDASSLRAALVAGIDRGAIIRAAAAMKKCGKSRDTARAADLKACLDATPEQLAQGWMRWCRIFLRDDWTAKDDAFLCGKDAQKLDTQALATMHAECARLAPLVPDLLAAQAAEVTGALSVLTAPVFERFRAAKQARASLDFDDLIQGARSLLESDAAPWVLFRLDGGLDHLLIDEAQDTSPAQWDIAAPLTGEFFAGEGARGALARSVFAVGDVKQSIFSFQGASPAHFTAAGKAYARRAQAGGAVFADVALPVSFRSTAPVLALVDAVQPAWAPHISARPGQAGRVELWPLFDPPATKPTPGADPPPEADQRCAEAIAETIRAAIDKDVLESRGRKMRPGDVLVLVRRRKAFVGHLVRALKQRGVPLAGTDRLRLTDSLAVQDCLAFLDCLLLPEDDLTLAAVLKGPFCGLSEDSLMTLAIDRKGPLIAALRTRAAERADWSFAAGLIDQARGRADFTDAHALLVGLLDGPVAEAPTGRAALIARLGEEAVEPIDELLQAALADSLRHPPSLQGFLHRLRTANAELKRDADQVSDAVRIMTVHGAKGLQAPVVFLADTVSMPDPPSDLLVLEGAPCWLPPKDARPQRLAEAAAAEDAAQRAEYERLLYVALTRAEDRLVVTGWRGRKGTPDPECWHLRVDRGFDALKEAVTEEVRDGIGTIRVLACPQAAAPDRVRDQQARPAPKTLPAWAAPARAEAPAPSRIKPSGEDDAPDGGHRPPPPTSFRPLAQPAIEKLHLIQT